MKKEEVLEMIRQLDDQYKRDRETLDRMLDLCERSHRSVASTPSIREESLSVADKILSYINGMDTNFTMQQLSRHISEVNPAFGKDLNDQAISTALWKLKKSQQVKVVIPKKGKSGAIYSRVQDKLL